MIKNPKRYTITAALPYTNGPIHIGHLAGVYVPSDIYSRYLRLQGRDVLFVCGSDEHGVAISMKAKKEGVSPQEIIDKYDGIIRKSFVDFGISFDNYSRTSSKIHHDTASEFFKKLYDKGVRIVTIPHTLWMLTGRFQKEYPDVLIKNTILRNTQRANEVIKQVEAGFHYINFDRDLMRDEDTLKRMQDVKKYCKEKLGVNVKYSLLANEGCWGNCPVQDEHFLYNNTRSKGNQPTYFQTDISYFSCPKWEEQDPAYHWRIANFPPFKDEWDRLLTYIDVIKMHGRESVSRLFETLKIIEKFANNEQILYTDFEIFIKDNKFAQKRIDVWKTTIRDTVKTALTKSKNNESKISEKTKNLPGLTSEKVKHFINNLCELPDCKYLEAGVFQGSIFAAAVERNDLVATAIDNFSESSIVPMDSNVNINSEKGNNKEIFLRNIKDLVLNKQVNIIDSNVFEADLNKISLKSNVIFMDIEHTYESHYNFLNKFYEKIDNTFVYVVDDWNWLQVRDATFKSIEDLKLKTLFKEEIFTKGEDKNDYWNGLGIFVLNKI